MEKLCGKGRCRFFLLEYEFEVGRLLLFCVYICTDPNTMGSRSVAEADSCPHCLNNYRK